MNRTLISRKKAQKLKEKLVKLNLKRHMPIKNFNKKMRLLVTS